VARYLYIVRPSLGQWEVGFGENGTCFLYAGRDEAVEVARGAARLHWETRNEPSGVRLDLPGEGPREIAAFGPSTEQPSATT
jgi:hypothetical protein